MKNKKTAVFDVETAPNKCMVGFMDLESGKIKQFQYNESKKISKYINTHRVVGYNSLNYDNILVTGMMRGWSIKDLYEASVDIIEGGGKWWHYPNDIEDAIDIMEVVQGSASLKLYGSRLNTKKLQDLPYDPHEKHSKKMWKNVCEYNKNDLRLTEELYNFVLPQLNLREDIGKEYKINVMSKSDAQTAESIFQAELLKVGIDAKKAGKKKVQPKVIKYVAPKTVMFRADYMNDLVEKIEKTKIEVNKGGSPVIPKWLKDEIIFINGKKYNIGLGGLHSMEKSVAVVPKKGFTLGNIDVASYYPSLIINLGFYPKHLSKKFLEIYSHIKDTRMAAKKSGNKVVADSLKIVLNGSYGKFGSNYSFLYAPDLMLGVTITGQLYLLMLIEQLEDYGVEVISSNTDGIEVMYQPKQEKKMRKIVSKWEKETGLDMEYGKYNKLYSRDVNSYIAIYDGYAKSKGFYSEPKIDKNREYQIVIDAIREFLLNGTDMEKTIRSCKDPAKFCVSRQVTGGALWSPEEYPNTDEYDKFIKEFEAGTRKDNKALRKRNDEYKKQFVLAVADRWYIGKVVRFYFAIGGKPMFYKKSGNRVPKSDGCKPMMDLKKKVPKDLDYKKYIELANIHLKECGYE